MRCKYLQWASALLLAVFTGSSSAEAVYQTPDDFIAEAFPTTDPAPRTLWISNEMRDEILALSGKKLGMLRIRYWQHASRTAWVLDEIGKELPITTGVVVDAGRIETVQVLVFRESRGWEVRYPFFTDQFIDVHLDQDKQLNRHIDNISGATLSVNALKRQASIALLLAAYIDTQGAK